MEPGESLPPLPPLKTNLPPLPVGADFPNGDKDIGGFLRFAPTAPTKNEQGGEGIKMKAPQRAPIPMASPSTWGS